jgi:cyclase
VLAFRLIARLDIKKAALVKSVNLEGVRLVGDPGEYAEKYDLAEIDEIVYIDTVASLYGRNHLSDVIKQATERIFCPVTVAGGVKSCDNVRELLLSGADKVAINTAALERPELITEVSRKFGAQCMVLQIDAKKTATGWEPRTNGGREVAAISCVEWARKAEALGAGEIFLTSIDQEGTRRGPDVALIEAVAGSVSVPVVYSGGIGNAQHVVDVANAGASGAAMSAALHYGLVSLSDTRLALIEAGQPVRRVA